ncbi:Hypothetical protein NTJ_00400 [Nesidiocoris tenuis]|uniref:Uncharacterized protein n=1 Tax=Nesidiocoris tenuis TaxID=355587 RepID=A0ABN7A5V0_9HEMI|nr:Hypothetical protein NTJ_00400 [Nesidiocoris tenuis]
MTGTIPKSLQFSSGVFPPWTHHPRAVLHQELLTFPDLPPSARRRSTVTVHSDVLNVHRELRSFPERLHVPNRSVRTSRQALW